MGVDVLFVVFVVFSVSTYLILKARLMDIVLGFALLSNGINLIIMFTSEDPVQKTVPIITETSTQSIVDPIPQALVLTAIVIGFGLIVFLTVMAFRLYAYYKHSDINDLGIKRDI